jgi:hypothetical protein
MIRPTLATGVEASLRRVQAIFHVLDDGTELVRGGVADNAYVIAVAQ